MASARELDVQLLPHREPDLEASVVSDTAGASCLDAAAGASAGEPPRGYTWRGILFTWVFPLLRRAAAAGQLDLADLFELTPEAKPQPLYEAFVFHWRKRAAALSPGRRRGRGWTLLRVLFAIHWPRMWLLWVGRIVQACLDFSFPLFLNLITNFVEDENSPAWKGLTLAALFFLVQLLSVVIDNNVSMGLQSLGLRIQSSMTTTIFHKVLTLRQDVFLKFSTGKLNNLITTDIDKSRRVVRYMHILIASPLKVVISLFSLYRLVGVSVFIGLIWMVVVIVVNPLMMYFASKLEDKQQSKTDERVRRATETLSAIQVVKCYAWEGPATQRVEEARRAELLSMWRLYCLYTCFEGLWSSIVPVTTAVMFASYALLNPDRPLDPATAFTAMALLQMVQEPLFAIPWVLNLVIEALVAARRIERLLVLQEARLPSTAHIGTFVPGGMMLPGSGDASHDGAEVASDAGPTDVAVDFTGESFIWPRSSRRQRADGENTADADGGEAEDGAEEDEEEAQAATSVDAAPGVDFRLSDLVLRLPRGVLVAVVGATGSGKTSLIQAVLGEMPEAPDAAASGPRRPPVKRHKPMAFAPQLPWVFNATVRQNILFGETFSEKRYADCLRCCGLEKDLALLKQGDQTRVGEKGIALSGGQKARVCLARAAYRVHVSNLFVLDDPYSALDAHVARQVHEEAVRGMLAKKTRVVVTNRLEFASDCDLVVVLDGGRIEAIGSFEEVRASSASFRALHTAQGLGTNEAEDDSGISGPSVLERAVSYTSAVSGGEDDSGSGLARQEGEDEGQAEVDEEARATGQIKKEVILYYLKQMGTTQVAFLACFYLISEGLNLALPVWLKVWTEEEPGPGELGRYLSIYVALSVCSIVFMTVRDLMGNVLSFKAARRLHASMFAAVLRAPMSFFQDTPQGRIINRFSKDMSEIDKELIWQLIYTVVPVLSVIGNFSLVGGIAYLSLLMFLPAFWLYYKCWKYYNRAALDLKRLSKVTSSPVYDHFSNLCRENAIMVVRAHMQVERQCRMNGKLVAEQQRPLYSQFYAEQWFCMCVETLGCTLVFFVALFAVLGRGRLVSTGGAALALTFAGDCSSSIQSLIGQIAEFGMAFNCVERVMEYSTTLPAEAPPLADRRPGPDWPAAGVLEVRDLNLRYRPGLPLVLKGVSFCTSAGERVGVVGRTGAGKSTLLLALLRITEPELGSGIRLDGEDLLALGLEDVRKGIAMIPQEPVLFQETLRYNCDPFGYCSNAEVWAALQEAQLGPWVRERMASAASTSGSDIEAASTPTNVVEADSAARCNGEATAVEPAPTAEELEKMLRLDIKEGGQNLSVGQRQMVAMARAVLRRSRMVVLDEATAAVDAATDAALQLAVRRCFAGATTLTIAHRLQTILDSDRVLVLSEGTVAELGPPEELRAMEDGIFRGMVEEARL